MDPLNLPRRKKRAALRILSALLAFTFGLQDVGRAVIDLGLKSQVDLSSFNLPADIGIVKETNAGKTRDTIFNIKDMHDNYGAQESIVHLLENLVANYNVRTIGVEGMEGFIDTSVLGALPDEEMRRNTASYMMRAGKLQAGEFFSAMNAGNIAIYGMDSNALYEENVAAFKAVLAKKEANLAKIAKLMKTLARFEESVYSEELRDLNKNGILNNSAGIKFSERWKMISSLADKHGIPYRQYPNIKSLMDSMEREKTMDFNKANLERDGLIERLNKSMATEKLEQLVSQSLAYKLGKISQGVFSSYLLETASSNGVKLADYPNLTAYADYMVLYESIDIDALKDEVKDLEERIREKLFRGDEERELFRLSKQADTLHDLFEVRLSSVSLAFYKSHASEFSAAAFEKFIAESGKKHGILAEPGLDVQDIFASMPDGVRFYEGAERRNNALLENTVRRMKENGQSMACLVTGGFHSRGIADLMKSEQMSYIVIMPRFDKKTTRPYLTIITNSQTSYADFARSREVLETKIEMTAHFFAQIAFRAAARVAVGTDAERNDKVQKEVAITKDLYMNAYRALQRKQTENGWVRHEPGVSEPRPSVPLSEGVKERRDDFKNYKQLAQKPDDVDTLAVRSYLQGNPVIDGMEVVFSEGRLLSLYTVNGVEYGIVASRAADGSVVIEDTKFQDSAKALFRAAKARMGTGSAAALAASAFDGFTAEQRVVLTAVINTKKGDLSDSDFEDIIKQARRKAISVDADTVRDMVLEVRRTTQAISQQITAAPAQAVEAKKEEGTRKEKEAPAERAAVVAPTSEAVRAKADAMAKDIAEMFALRAITRQMWEEYKRNFGTVQTDKAAIATQERIAKVIEEAVTAAGGRRDATVNRATVKKIFEEAVDRALTAREAEMSARGEAAKAEAARLEAARAEAAKIAAVKEAAAKAAGGRLSAADLVARLDASKQGELLAAIEKAGAMAEDGSVTPSMAVTALARASERLTDNENTALAALLAENLLQKGVDLRRYVDQGGLQGLEIGLSANRATVDAQALRAGLQAFASSMRTALSNAGRARGGVSSAVDHTNSNAEVASVVNDLGTELKLTRDAGGKFNFRAAVEERVADRDANGSKILRTANGYIELTAQDELIIVDSRLTFDHYGRTENAVYASNKQLAAHELTELRLWREALSQLLGIDEVQARQDARNGLLRDWVQNFLNSGDESHAALIAALDAFAHKRATETFGDKAAQGDNVKTEQDVVRLVEAAMKSNGSLMRGLVTGAKLGLDQDAARALLRQNFAVTRDVVGSSTGTSQAAVAGKAAQTPQPVTLNVKVLEAVRNNLELGRGKVRSGDANERKIGLGLAGAAAQRLRAMSDALSDTDVNKQKLADEATAAETLVKGLIQTDADRTLAEARSAAVVLAPAEVAKAHERALNKAEADYAELQGTIDLLTSLERANSKDETAILEGIQRMTAQAGRIVRADLDIRDELAKLDAAGITYNDADPAAISLLSLKARTALTRAMTYYGKVKSAGKEAGEIDVNEAVRRILSGASLKGVFTDLLYTHRTTAETLAKIFGSGKMLAPPRTGNGVYRGINFRYGLDSDYGEVVLVMKQGFEKNYEGVDVKGKPVEKTSDKKLVDLFQKARFHYGKDLSAEEFKRRLAEDYDFREHLEKMSDGEDVIAGLGTFARAGLNPQLQLGQNVSLEDVEKVMVPEHLYDQVVASAQGRFDVSKIVKVRTGSSEKYYAYNAKQDGKNTTEAARKASRDGLRRPNFAGMADGAFSDISVGKEAMSKEEQVYLLMLAENKYGKGSLGREGQALIQTTAAQQPQAVAVAARALTQEEQKVLDVAKLAVGNSATMLDTYNRTKNVAYLNSYLALLKRQIENLDPSKVPGEEAAALKRTFEQRLQQIEKAMAAEAQARAEAKAKVDARVESARIQLQDAARTQDTEARKEVGKAETSEQMRDALKKLALAITALETAGLKAEGVSARGLYGELTAKIKEQTEKETRERLAAVALANTARDEAAKATTSDEMKQALLKVIEAVKALEKSGASAAAAKQLELDLRVKIKNQLVVENKNREAAARKSLDDRAARVGAVAGLTEAQVVLAEQGFARRAQAVGLNAATATLAQIQKLEQAQKDLAARKALDDRAVRVGAVAGLTEAQVVLAEQGFARRAQAV
ncbi:MAG TPA: hypothetical protein VL404_06415, partial [Candidatus Eisenbacteria bacterium]|nr:hypothetical protein [Candidatus Eisenbacteria bacterium]